MTNAPGFRLEGESTPLRQLCGDIVRSRDLVAILARQTFYVQYRRAVFGVLWSIVLPLIQAVVLAVILTNVTDLGRGLGSGPDFVTFIFTGTVAWSFLSGSVISGSTSIVNGSGLTTKVYFPRSVLPIVTVAANLYGFVASTIVLLGLCIAIGVPLTARLAVLPAAVLLAISITTALTLLLAGLHVYFRDVRYFVAAAIQPWFYITPIFYSLDRIGSARPFVEANPMTGVVLLFRWATIGTHEPMAAAVSWTIGWTLLFLVAGLVLYRRYERVFADLM